ncbi:MAG TPA: ribosome biogenesis GTPase Der [Terriglobia bacterium]|nr:ribosome biogenesis GTPase Der [Terriglobia bacterium]
MNRLSRVAIVGQPNVGKSTLFNRIVGRRRALVGNEPGMTRDRLYGRAQWLGREFEVVDTGGMMEAVLEEPTGSAAGGIAAGILRQARAAIREADHVILVADARQGLLPLDEELARRLRATGKPLTLAVNKVDSDRQEALGAEFHRLGIEGFLISAEHGRGVDELLDHIVSSLAPATRPEGAAGAAVSSPPQAASAGDEPATPAAPADDAIRVAIIGRPNVGKSTLLNRLLNEERSIVTPVPGTTRDAVDAGLETGGRRFRLIDTAGIRRKGKTHLLAEKLSVIQARKHLERSDVAVLVLDATEGVAAADAHIGGYAYESRRSVVIAVNKWDAAPKDQAAVKEFTESVRDHLKYLSFAPLVFISALKGRGLGKLLETIVEVAAARRYRVPTAEMNRFLQQLDFERVPSPGGKPLRLYYLTQAAVSPPTFVAFTNRSGAPHFSVERFLENRIRERFPFTGTPLVVEWRQR